MSSVIPRTASGRVDKPADVVSLPLYISGLIVTWCGIEAVNSVLANDRFTSATMMLATLGFIFSVTCRWMAVDRRIINSIPVVLGAYVTIRLIRHSLDITAFVPAEVLQSDMMIAVLLVWLSVVRAWTLTSDGAVVFTAVTSVAMIGLVGAFNVNADLIFFFVVFVMASLYMVMHQNYLVHRTWLPSQKSPADSTILKTHVILCVVLGLASMTAGTLLVVPVKMVFSGLSLGQAMKQFFAPTSASDIAKIALVDFSDDPTVAIGTGDGYTGDDTVVMVARPSDLQEHYWRGRTYDHYTRHGWTSTLGTPIYPVPPATIQVNDVQESSFVLRRFTDYEGDDLAQTQPATKSATATPVEPLRTRFDVMMGRTSTVYSPSGTTEILLSPRLQTNLEQTADGYVGYDSLQQKFSYIAVSSANTPTPKTLEAIPAGLHYPPVIRQTYLDDRGQDVLSTNERVRIGETALNIVNSVPERERTEYNKAEAIRRWVSQTCTYSLKVDPVPQDADAVSYFLFVSHKGYCDLFASSMALLCRYAGIPARLVTGFAPGTVNQKQTFDIRARDKHAWVEVYFPTAGWVQFDPTGGAATESKTSETKEAFDGLRALYFSLMVFLNLNGPVPVMLFATVVICLTYVIKIEVVDRIREQMRIRSKQTMIQQSGATSDADAELIQTARHVSQDRYRRLSHALVLMGLPVRGARTPVAYAALSHRVLPGRYRGQDTVSAADLLAAVDALTEDIGIASYAPDATVAELLSKERDLRASNASAVVEKAKTAHWRKGVRWLPFRRAKGAA